MILNNYGDRGGCNFFHIYMSSNTSCLNTIVMQMRFVAIQTLLNFGMMKVNSGHHSGHPNRNIRYYDSEGNDDDIGEGGEPILGELSYPNKSSAVLRVKSVQCSA